jgi:hypothetical protein
MAAQEGDNQMNNCFSIDGCTISNIDSNTYLTDKQWRPGGSSADHQRAIPRGRRGFWAGRGSPLPAGEKIRFFDPDRLPFGLSLNGARTRCLGLAIEDDGRSR